MALLSMVHKTTLMFWQNWIRCYLESRIYFTPETNYSLLHLKACLFENVKYIPVVPEEVYFHLHILQVRTPLLVTVPQSPVDTGAHMTRTTNIIFILTESVPSLCSVTDHRMKNRTQSFTLIITFLTISHNVLLATSDTLSSLYDNPNDEYFDIDEGALVKVEFSKTLRKVIICR